jgi:hypothetical protein
MADEPRHAAGTQSRPNALPDGFADLEPLVGDWSFGSEHDRREKRATSSFDELHAYYGLAGPRVREIAAHLDGFPMGTLPAPQQHLLQLAFMFMEVAMAVEFYGQPEVRDGFPRQRWVISPR